jgi:hypothetical protein
MGSGSGKAHVLVLCVMLKIVFFLTPRGDAPVDAVLQISMNVLLVSTVASTNARTPSGTTYVHASLDLS